MPSSSATWVRRGSQALALSAALGLLFLSGRLAEQYRGPEAARPMAGAAWRSTLVGLAGEPAAAQAAEQVRVREGTAVAEQVGTFTARGDRFVFATADGKQQFVALENLGLQRVAERLAGNPDPLWWKVSGVATEYRGGSFLLIEHAVLTSLPAAPARAGRPGNARR